MKKCTRCSSQLIEKALEKYPDSLYCHVCNFWFKKKKNKQTLLKRFLKESELTLKAMADSGIIWTAPIPSTPKNKNKGNKQN